jgi:hypothetical protein
MIGREVMEQTINTPQPSIKTVTEYDFLKCRDFIESQIPGGGDLLWQHACDYWSLSNDSYINCWVDEESFDAEREKDEQTRAVMKLFYESFIKPHANANLMFWVCW